MRKKSLYSAVMLALVLGMTACGDGSEDVVNSKPDQIMELVPQTEETKEQTENSKTETEEIVPAEELTAEEYLKLAEQYREQGLIRKQRDALEKSYRLYGDQTAFETLQTITVNLAEEEEAIQAQANLMLQNLELEEYLGESINLIATEEWFKSMMPKLYEGSRSYFLQKDGQTHLYIQAGYDQWGKSYAKVWYLGEQARVLRRAGDTVQLLETTVVDGNYQGAFTSWTCDGSTGDIYHETGTFGNGVLTGDYTIAIHEGTEASDVFSLWSNKDGMKYTTYNGNFDEKGNTTLEQPAEKKIASLIKDTDYSTCIVYAIDVNDCLFEGLPEGVDPALYTFGIETMGWEMHPAYTAYEPIEDPETEENVNDAQTATDIKVRIFDGELQICEKGMWIDMGSVEKYIQADPFLAYENTKPDTGKQDADGSSPQNGLGHKRSGGTIPKDKVVTKPATQKPAQQEQPQETPQQTTPTPAPTPTPTPTPAPAPTPTPTPMPEPTPTPEPTPPADNSGNDVDVEWTPDIL